MADTVNLYSDTQTRPTAAMRAVMADALVGDEQRGLDPTTRELERRVAELLGHEAAVFLPTGTMGNLVAVGVHTRPGDAVVLERSAHVLRSETAGAAAVSGCLVEALAGDAGTFGPDDLAPVLRAGSRHEPRTALVCLEQTHNFAGGACWPHERYVAVASLAREHGVAVHTDGARLLNAVVATGVPAPRWGEPVDSIWLDFTKGLGAPIGAVLAGSAGFVEQAWVLKHRFGGAMRQSGIAAAACLHALDHHVERLADDHRRARALADGFAELGLRVVAPDTNLVYADPRPAGRTADALAADLARDGVEVSVVGPRLRACTHLDVGDADVERALEVLARLLRRG